MPEACSRLTSPSPSLALGLLAPAAGGDVSTCTVSGSWNRSSLCRAKPSMSVCPVTHAAVLMAALMNPGCEMRGGCESTLLNVGPL